MLFRSEYGTGSTSTPAPGQAVLPYKALAIGAAQESGMAIVYGLTDEEKVDKNVTGKLYGWGRNYKYQLTGSTSGSMPLPKLLAGRDDIGMVGGAGAIYSIDKEGNLLMSGEGASGQLGDGKKEASTAVQYLRIPLKDGTDEPITDALGAASAINGKHTLSH